MPTRPIDQQIWTMPPAAAGRTLQDRLRDYLSAKDYGAIGNGITDDTAAIQAAINAAYAQKKPLHIPQGSYKITAPLTLTASGADGDKRGLLIAGDGPAAWMDRNYFAPTSGFTILDASSVAPASWPTNRSMLEFTNLNNVTLQDLWFLGNNTQGRNDQGGNTNGVEFIGVTTGHHIEGCTFQLHKRGLTMGLTGVCGWSSIVDNMFTANWFMGAYQNGGDSQWIGNYFNESTPGDQNPTNTIGVGIFFDQSRSNSVIGGKIEYNSKGIHLANCADILIAGLMTDKNTYAIVSTNDSSINLWAGKGITITGNKFLASGGSMLTGSMHLYFASTNSPKVTAAITGNVFSKGSTDAYSENDGTYGGLSVPSITSHTTAAGTLAAQTWYYRVTAQSDWGQTVGSTEVSHVLGAPGGVALGWTVSSGSHPLVQYKVYRGATSGTEALIATIPAGTVSYTDNGSAVAGGENPPTITPDDIINVVGASGTHHITFSGNNFEGAAGRSWIYVDGAAGSRLTVSGNTGTFLPLPLANVAYAGDIPSTQFTAAPTTATWRRGDVIWHSAPNSSTTPGWICIAAGTPGTWMPMQTLGPLVQLRKTLTYSASMTIDAATGNEFVVTPSNGTAFTFAVPTNAVAGQRITVRVVNTFGTLGAATWTTGAGGFRQVGWVNPLNGYSRSVDFQYDGTNWIQADTVSPDVPNTGAAANIGSILSAGTPVALTGQTANLAATNVFAAAPVGRYRVSATARTTTSGTGTTATLNIIWTDEGGVKTHLVGTWALNSVTVTGQINVSEVIHAAAATNIQVSVTAGTYGTSVYAISATAERLD